MIGKEGQGVQEISTILNISRLYSAVSATGYLGRGLAIARSFAHVREVGAGKGRRIMLKDAPLHMDTLARTTGEYHAMMLFNSFVEKAAEHLTAVDEAWDNQMNFALSHVLGATIQTALFNAPLVVIVGWGLGKGMDFHFEAFDIIVLILSILVIGNFLRDQKSNYLEGALCIIVYCIIAVAAFYYPNPEETTAVHE